MTNTYLFRSCRNIPLESDRIGYGWDDINFSDFSDGHAIIHHITQKLGWNIGKKGNQIHRFKAISDGDIIVVPWWSSIVIARATGHQAFDQTYYGKAGCNQHLVKFFRDSNGEVILIPRSNLSEAFQKRLKIRHSLVSINDFAEEIDHIITNLQQGKDYYWTAQKAEEIAADEQKQKDLLLHNIQKGFTNLRSGGLGFEHLIRELLEIEGYTATIQAKNALPAGVDVDIIAERSGLLGENEATYLIQAKHNEGQSGRKGLEQLTALSGGFMPDHDDANRVFITSADQVTKDAEEYGKANNISIYTGADVVTWIFDSFEQLQDETRQALGLHLSPRVF